MNGQVLQVGSVDTIVMTGSHPCSPGAFHQPKQLPPPPGQFVNRVDALGALDRLTSAVEADAPPLVVVVSGMSGVGKSAVVLRWAYANRGRFTGGQFYADIGDPRFRGRTSVDEVAAGFLRALGVHKEYVPSEPAERSAMFRTRTADAPVLVVLDDVDGEEQVAPLLPGSPGSVVLVTSRRRLSGLVYEGAHLLHLRPLDDSESSALVARMLPEGRLRAGSQEAEDLVRLCGGLPVALRVVGARLAQRPRWSPSRLVEHLADEERRLGRLSMGERIAVEPVFDAVVEQLPPLVRQLYRRLGLHPGPFFSAPVAAIAMDVPVDDAEEVLEQLVEANLVGEVGQERFRFHDLVRLHARRRAEQDEVAAVRDDVVRRISHWYLAAASSADHAVAGPARWRLYGQYAGVDSPTFSPAEAADWLGSEKQNLLAVVEEAFRREWHDLVLRLCEALWPFYHGHKHYQDWKSSHRMGVESALREGSLVAEARMRNQLARAHIETGEFDRADRELEAARRLAVESGEPRAEAVVLESLGVLRRDEHRYSEAADHFRASLAANETIGDERGIALQGYHLGDVLLRGGDPVGAAVVLEEALRQLQGLGDEMSAAKVDVVRGRAYQVMGRLPEAQDVLVSAVAVARRRHQPVKEAQALEALADVARSASDVELLTACAGRLVELYTATGSPRAAVVAGWTRENGQVDD
ncbi:tetratricopeptide repeat protein [Umezawaea beigongshangensis]|uniref:tetratricopeptide repeat protein n=1 Tax=Umezawaea beigongshangensis TaxID=2780383 RepID=UPI0018F1C460|nr:tetratricopeptide repeat protein [Umezawaea beigongshangensis]